jgi:sarcosine oxidase, subunit beta
MNETADLVIIGGGIAGTSVAYHLAQRGAAPGVVLLERDTLGSGTTSAAGGGIRSQFTTEINIRLSLESAAFWRRAQEELGETVDYVEDGYLFVARTAEERDLFRANVTLQNSLGVPSRFLEPDEIGRAFPWVNVSDVTAGTYSAKDGLAGPNEAVQAFARRARGAGVRIHTGVSVTGIDVAHGRVAGVETTLGRIDTPVVLIAAGPWSALVGELAGVDIPVTPYRRTTYVSEPFDGLPREIPHVIDIHVGWSMRREGEAVRMSGRRDPRPSYERYVDFDGLARSAEIATHRVPALAGARFGKRAMAGIYDVSPDNHAIMGRVPEVEGLYVATGFSGHGFMHSPATGRLMAELILDGRTTGIDIAPLSIERFRTGALLSETLQIHVRAAD